jgi:hypothetical protein
MDVGATSNVLNDIFAADNSVLTLGERDEIPLPIGVFFASSPSNGRAETL